MLALPPLIFCWMTGALWMFFRDAFELIRASRAELYGHAWLIAFVEGGTRVDDVLTGKQGSLVKDESSGEVVPDGTVPGAGFRRVGIPRRSRRQQGRA